VVTARLVLPRQMWTIIDQLEWEILLKKGLPFGAVED
tara:strand:+ start:3190 stop:3300 length:111 start_codon:yes stop_codon:yes gene_type:complete